jgi:hypothetical protein
VEVHFSSGLVEVQFSSGLVEVQFSSGLVEVWFSSRLVEVNTGFVVLTPGSAPLMLEKSEERWKDPIIQ